ncbi:cytochrome c oxidase subunit 4 [Pedobacter sp. L105]|uniref:aa3-type cytochrome oxidase subunit IV n=1 Tax=Pedobacter sp. L105 TaxID=1641871 RepID=UPI00131DB2C0|nr:cytochrome c oxidase subunit 4 [Pedobacter sp. L105]
MIEKDNFSRIGWKTKAKPAELPKPSYWPFFTALGFAFLLWGMVAGWILSVTGLLIIIVGLSGWINNLRDETRGNRNQ